MGIPFSACAPPLLTESAQKDLETRAKKEGTDDIL